MRVPIPTKAGQGRSKPLSTEMLVNMFAELAPKKGISEVVALGTPGWSEFASTPDAPIRGMYRTLRDSTFYVVAGFSLFTVNSDGVFSASLGTIGGFGRVGFSDNGNEICIISNQETYLYSVAEGFQKLNSLEFPGATSVTFMDGFFVFSNQNALQRGQFFISAILDGDVFDALDFASAERYPDNIVRVFADHSELLLFGTDSIEIWFNAGGSDFLFARSQGSAIENGLGAYWSVQKIDESVVWLDEDGIVRRLEGNTPARISDHTIEHLITLGDWQNATSWSYTQEGHQFYVLTIPAADTSQKAGTYVYDAATKLWHQRQGFEMDFYPLAFFVKIFGKFIAGDYATGTLYEMSLDCYQENGKPLISEMHFPQLQNDGERFIVHKVELALEVGSITKQEVTAVPPPPIVASSMFIMGNQNKDNFHTFDLTDTTKLSTAGFVLDTISFDFESFFQQSAFFYGGGSILIMAGDGVFFQYSGDPYDFNTLGYDFVNYDTSGEVDGINGYPVSLRAKNNDEKLYACDFTTIYEWDTGSATIYNISNLSFTGNTFDHGELTDLRSFDLVNNGTKLFALFADDLIRQYTLTTPYDISTAVFDNKTYPSDEQESTAFCILFTEDEQRFYISGNSSTIFQYSISNYDLDTVSLDAGENTDPQEGAIIDMYIKPA